MLDVREFCDTDTSVLYEAVEPGVREHPEKSASWLADNRAAGPAFTALYQNKPIAIGGIKVRLYGDRVLGFPWLVVSHKGHPMRKSLYRTVKTMLRILSEQVGAHQLYIDTADCFTAAARVAKHLGFTRCAHPWADKTLWVRYES